MQVLTTLFQTGMCVIVGILEKLVLYINVYILPNCLATQKVEYFLTYYVSTFFSLTGLCKNNLLMRYTWTDG